MALDRRAYLSVCIASVLVMAGSGIILWSRWEKSAHAVAETADPALSAGTGWPAAAAHPAAVPIAPPPVLSTATAPAAPAATPPPTAPALSKKRNIRFSYRNSKPSKVEIIGTFSNWTPSAMTKGENHTWEITVPLDAGEYGYNFIVDGKVVRDPNNPRTAPEGRSLLVVQPIQ